MALSEEQRLAAAVRMFGLLRFSSTHNLVVLKMNPKYSRRMVGNEQAFSTPCR